MLIIRKCSSLHLSSGNNMTAVSYGMCALLAAFAIPLEYCVYEKPQLFVLSLLALNSAASIIVIEYLNVDYYGRTTFDTPALRAGKFMVSLAVALAIVITFQLFVLRKPARRTLRRSVGALVYSNLAYNTILQAYVRAVLPADPKQRGRPAVLKRIERELKYREAKMQAQIIEIGPLMAWVIFNILRRQLLTLQLVLLQLNPHSLSHSEENLYRKLCRPAKSSSIVYGRVGRPLVSNPLTHLFWNIWSASYLRTDDGLVVLRR